MVYIQTPFLMTDCVWQGEIWIYLICTSEARISFYFSWQIK